jgi:hypothetical protein
MKLIPNWKKSWRRYSTWLALALPAMTVAREALPNLQDLIPLPQYKLIAGVLGFAIVVAMNIKQKSVSGGPKDESDKTQPPA